MGNWRAQVISTLDVSEPLFPLNVERLSGILKAMPLRTPPGNRVFACEYMAHATHPLLALTVKGSSRSDAHTIITPRTVFGQLDGGQEVHVG